MPLCLRTQDVAAHQVVGVIRVFRAREFGEKPSREKNLTHVGRRKPCIRRGLKHDVDAEGITTADANQCRTVRFAGRISFCRVEPLVSDIFQQSIALPLIVANVAVRTGMFHRDSELLSCGHVFSP